MTSERAVLLTGKPLVAGSASGDTLVIEQGLSLAMALDVTSGRITDVHSPHAGVSVSGRVLVMPSGRGSSSASTALAEAIRLGTAPAAIVLEQVDEILVVGAIVARALYGRTCPIVQVDGETYRSMSTLDRIVINRDGSMSGWLAQDPP